MGLVSTIPSAGWDPNAYTNYSVSAEVATGSSSYTAGTAITGPGLLYCFYAYNPSPGEVQLQISVDGASIYEGRAISGGVCGVVTPAYIYSGTLDVINSGSTVAVKLTPLSTSYPYTGAGYFSERVPQPIPFKTSITYQLRSNNYTSHYCKIEYAKKT